MPQIAGEQVLEPIPVLLVQGPVKAELVPDGGQVCVAQAADPTFAVQDGKGVSRENPQHHEDEHGNTQQGGYGVQ